MFHSLKKCFPQQVDSISIKQLGSCISDEKMRLIDVRTEQEYLSGHIKASRNVPLDKIDGFKDTKDKTYLIICQSGMRSQLAAQKMRKKGYTVINVKGGMNAWRGPVQGGK